MRRNLAIVLAIFLLSSALLILPANRSFVTKAQVADGERLAMYSKPAVVRIIEGATGQFYFQPPGYQGVTYNVGFWAFGSGFFISSNGYVATNAHVVSTTHDGEQKAKQALFWQMMQQIGKSLGKDPRSLNGSFIDQYSQLQNFKLFHHVLIPDGSAFPFEIKQYGSPTGETQDQGKDVAIVKIEVKNAPVLTLGDSERVQLQEHVTAIGYPAAADTFDTGLLSSKSALEASVNDGKISAKKQASSGAPILQTSAGASHGSSGEPVLNDKGEVIGLVTFRGDTVNNQEVQGFTFVVPSNTVMEYIRSAGETNKPGLIDQLYHDGLDLFWTQHYSEARTKFEEVKRLFPQHSEVDRLIQSSQQAITEGRDQSGIGVGWLVGGVLVVLFLIVSIIVIGVVVFLLLRRRSKAQSAKAAGVSTRPSPGPSPGSPEPARPRQPPYSPSPSAAPAAAQVARPPSAPAATPMSTDRTVDLSQTVAIPRATDTAPISYGSIKFVSGILAGQQFEVKAEGACIGRDSNLSQIVIADPRISKRHVWIGVRDGRVGITDQGSRNGTFLNDPKSERITETALNPGDTVILGESDVARFEYQI